MEWITFRRGRQGRAALHKDAHYLMGARALSILPGVPHLPSKDSPDSVHATNHEKNKKQKVTPFRGSDNSLPSGSEEHNTGLHMTTL